MKRVKPTQMDYPNKWLVCLGQFKWTNKNRIVYLSWSLNELNNKKKNGKNNSPLKKMRNKIGESTKTDVLFKIKDNQKRERKKKNGIKNGMLEIWSLHVWHH